MFRRAQLIRFVSGAERTPLHVQNEPRRHRKLYSLLLREEQEERIRDFLPEKPLVPNLWSLMHIRGSNRFDLFKELSVRGSRAEKIHTVALMETKQYEATYRMDNGERDEQEYLNFSVFIQKPNYPKGGLEFGLTSIDSQLVLDSLTMHTSNEGIDCAIQAFSSTSMNGSSTRSKRKWRDSHYRGPLICELDEELCDEILDYLDERGINDAFAEYMISQSYFYEQEEYLNWLRLLKNFSH